MSVPEYVSKVVTAKHQASNVVLYVFPGKKMSSVYRRSESLDLIRRPVCFGSIMYSTRSVLGCGLNKPLLFRSRLSAYRLLVGTPACPFWFRNSPCTATRWRNLARLNRRRSTLCPSRAGNLLAALRFRSPATAAMQVPIRYVS